MVDDRENVFSVKGRRQEDTFILFGFFILESRSVSSFDQSTPLRELELQCLFLDSFFKITRTVTWPTLELFSTTTTDDKSMRRGFIDFPVATGY